MAPKSCVVLGISLIRYHTISVPCPWLVGLAHWSPLLGTASVVPWSYISSWWTQCKLIITIITVANTGIIAINVTMNQQELSYNYNFSLKHCPVYLRYKSITQSRERLRHRKKRWSAPHRRSLGWPSEGRPGEPLASWSSSFHQVGFVGGEDQIGLSCNVSLGLISTTTERWQ